MYNLSVNFHSILCEKHPSKTYQDCAIGCNIFIIEPRHTAGARMKRDWKIPGASCQSAGVSEPHLMSASPNLHTPWGSARPARNDKSSETALVREHFGWLESCILGSCALAGQSLVAGPSPHAAFVIACWFLPGTSRFGGVWRVWLGRHHRVPCG